MLPSFEIERFRTFSHLVIPRLGRVNLIVGRNGAGKTMLLEALRLYASEGDPEILEELLLDRDELEVGPAERDALGGPAVRLESLFHGRGGVLGAANAIRLASSEADPLALRIQFAAFPQCCIGTGLGRRLSSLYQIER